MKARSDNLVLFAIAAVGAVGIFIVPWFAPLAGPPVISDSYSLGFANWAASLMLLLTAAALAAVSARSRTVSMDGPLWHHGRQAGRRRALAVTLVLTAVSLVAAAGLVWLTWGVAYGESQFFVDRMAQLAAGYRPYLDFGYGYALGALYGPVWLWRLFREQGLSPLGAYFIVYVAFALVSYWMLYLVVGRLALSDGRRAWILAALGIVPVLNFSLGIQYLLLRYLAPAVALVALHAWFTSARSRGSGRPYLGAVIGLLSLAATLMIASSEMALATFAGTVAYLAVLALKERKTALLCAGVYLACLLPLAALGRGSFALVASFATGAYNLPVLPGPPALLYVLAVFIVALLLPGVLRGSSAAERPLTVGLVALSATLVPAAFGRADSGHLFLNGLIVFVLAAAFLARLRPRFFVPFLVAVAVVFSVASYAYITQIGKGQLLTSAATSRTASDAQFGFLSRVLSWPPFAEPGAHPADYAIPPATKSLRDLSGYSVVSAPLGFAAGDPATAFDLAAAGRLALAPTGGTGFTRPALDKELTAMAKADCLLIPLRLVPDIDAADPASTPEAGWLSRPKPLHFTALTLFPLGLYERNPQPNLGGIFVAFVQQNYRRAGTWGDYAVYVPKAATTPPR